MRDVTGVAQLEDKLLLYSDHHGKPSVECQEEADRICRDIFGICSSDAEFVYPDNYWSLPPNSFERYKIEDDYEEHEDRFTSPRLDPEGQVAFLLAFGLDFTAAHGSALRCTRIFARAAEVAARDLPGFKTKLPSPEDVSANAFATRLAVDVAAFQKRKRRG
jgi:hypothetical protein